MKKIMLFCLMLCFLLSTITFTACGNKLSATELTIANYDQYQSISVGVATDQNIADSASVATKASKSSKKKKPCLIGQKPDGTFERITFEEEKDGEILVSNYGIRAIKNLGGFFILLFRQNYSGYIYYDGFPSQSSSELLFALHKSTGKMFDISKSQLKFYISFTEECYCASSDDSFFANCNNYDSGKFTISKFTVVNNKLEIKEVLDRHKFSDFGYHYVADRYGNLYSEGGYMLTAGGKLKVFEGATIAKNSIAYVGNMWVNAEGELEEASFVPDNLLNMNISSSGYPSYNYYCGERYLIYQEESTSYYRNQYDNPNKIYKYTFINDIEYTLDIITMEKYKEETGVIVNDRIYFLEGTEIYYINVKDGSCKSISSDYFFNKIYTNNQGEVIFEGIDEYQNDIIGVIYQDDSYRIGITPKKFEIYYIEPIN